MKSIKQIIKSIGSFKESILITVIVIMGVIMSIASPYFLTGTNIEAMLLGLSVEGIMTIGMVILLISGGLDLSVGSTLGFTGVVTGLALTAHIPAVISIIIGLSAAAAIGLINGLLIARVNLNPFITTLGMMMAVRGLMLVIAQGKAILNMPPAFKALGQGRFLGIQYPIYILIILIIIGDILLRNLRFFRQSYYVGGNESSAKLNGINVGKVKIFNYCLVAVLSGFAGILVTARFGSASVTVGQGMEMNVITAAIIGGASLNGGEGSVFGAFLGALFMQIISSSLNLLGVDIYWQNFITGAILIGAILVDALSEKRKAKVTITRN